MKHILLVSAMCVLFTTTFVGCDKVQQAADAIDKATTFSDGLQKKAKGIIPGYDQRAGDNKNGEAGDKDNEEKAD